MGKTSKQTGNEGEKFVATYLQNLNFITEIHPRTSRPVLNKEGKPVYVNGRPLRISSDNDYHNNFDVKAERTDFMIYVQAKADKSSKKSNASTAQKDIDHDYPHQFPYQRIQTWQLWKEWVAKPHRHKEFRFRIQERQGFTNKMWKKDGEIFPKGNWVDIDPSVLIYSSSEENKQSVILKEISEFEIEE